MEDIQIENIDIPIQSDNIDLKGSIFYTSDVPDKAPFIINCPGLYDHRFSPFVQIFTEKFTKSGYYVLSYDYRAHGETKKQTRGSWLKHIFKIFSDIHVVIDWILNNESDRLLEDKIALFGRSLGAAMILTQGYENKHAKKLIGLCARYSYAQIKNIEFPQDVIEYISPKYYLKQDPANLNRILIAHCKDDPRIPFDHFREIKAHLGFDNHNAIEYDTGGHSFKGNREELFQRVLDFLQTW
ncbi:MAG: alpha/beta hydrolase family protein [Candidatus Hermodarchaeota archaeon]